MDVKEKEEGRRKAGAYDRHFQLVGSKTQRHFHPLHLLGLAALSIPEARVGWA